jgi:hypothetical protein
VFGLSYYVKNISEDVSVQSVENTCKTDEVTGDWEKLHDEELCNWQLR